MKPSKFFLGKIGKIWAKVRWNLGKKSCIPDLFISYGYGRMAYFKLNASTIHCVCS